MRRSLRAALLFYLVVTDMDLAIDTSSTAATPFGAMQSARSRLLVLMFTDLVGSTGMKDELTTAGYLPLLRRHDELLREAVTSAGGQVQQDTGDGCFAVFATPSDAVRAALVIQWNLNAEPWPDGRRLCARVGIHLGEVAETEVRQDGGQKLVGMAVDLAARVMSLAQGQQILLTRGAFNDARQFVAAHPGGIVAIRWIAHGPYVFKGSDEPFDIFEVGVEGHSPLVPPPNSDKAHRALRAGEEQTLGWRPAIGLTLPGAPLWIVEKKLGEGGFGEVWLARHVKAGSVRVFKFCFDAERLRALKREVVLFRLLKEALGDRRDISRVIDWRFDEPPYFIEMEYVPGGNLADWVDQQGGIGKVSFPARLNIIAQVAEAISAAHSVGILHKDIKPSNVMMGQDADGTVYPRLTDFGIGILTDRDRLKHFNITAAGFTASNITMDDSSRTGTRMYSPPESMSGKPHTVQGDVYALGVLLYQVVIGDLERPLGVGWERQVEDELLREDIAACVDVEPTRRLGSAGELAQRLGRLESRRRERGQLGSWCRRPERVSQAGYLQISLSAMVGAFHLIYVSMGLAEWILGMQLIRSPHRVVPFLLANAAAAVMYAAWLILGLRILRGSRVAMWISLVWSIQQTLFDIAVWSGVLRFTVGGVLESRDARAPTYALFTLLGLTIFCANIIALLSEARSRQNSAWSAALSRPVTKANPA